ncbi:hypothetical protein A6R68_11035 [Neotoma lepida]|uniref:Small ribosomal subunit protein eS10 n=1 Tax=Neotoma lepida TaxID=56216 RepID=A0A1A6FWB7_NEOLE|nr:hypothetical protein A6R68_11035 [Neotoma lepida]
MLLNLCCAVHAPSFPASISDPAAAAMLKPKKTQIAIYELLCKEGVLVAKKDVHMPKHPELADKNVPSLHVLKAVRSLKTQGYVQEQFVWRHFFWYLTNRGIQHLRDDLHLPPEKVLAPCCVAMLKLAGLAPRISEKENTLSAEPWQALCTQKCGTI